MVAIIAAIILLVSAKIGLHVERVAVDSDALLEFAASGRKAGQGDLDRISDIVVKGALLYGHRWITETVDEAGARSTAPWKVTLSLIEISRQASQVSCWRCRALSRLLVGRSASARDSDALKDA